METVENKYITVAYKLYSIENGEKDFEEEAPVEHPFQFICCLLYTSTSPDTRAKPCAAWVAPCS